jgi:iron-sulfur cluster assembly accessory protein
MLETQPQTPENVPAPETEIALVTLSDAAVAKLTELTKEESDPNVGLRVYVYSGGCSGYRYGMMLEDQPAEEDVKVTSKGINVYVDPQSTKLLQGSEIDYVDTLMGAGFTVNNPNAVSGCGCGSSFRTEESAGAPGACGH